MRVYSDTGGFRKELINLECEGKISLIMFPYENINRKISDSGLPSRATFNDLDNFTWGTLPGTFGDYEGSEKFTEIENVVGRHNRVDALHLDSAFKSKCKCFLTRDKDDILSKSESLSKLLAIKIFHCDDDWNEFVQFVTQDHEQS